MPDTLYKRLGGHDAIAAVCDDLLPQLMGATGSALLAISKPPSTLSRSLPRSATEVLGFINSTKADIVE